jgi:hypothetical protein
VWDKDGVGTPLPDPCLHALDLFALISWLLRYFGAIHYSYSLEACLNPEGGLYRLLGPLAKPALRHDKPGEMDCALMLHAATAAAAAAPLLPQDEHDACSIDLVLTEARHYNFKAGTYTQVRGKGGFLGVCYRTRIVCVLGEGSNSVCTGDWGSTVTPDRQTDSLQQELGWEVCVLTHLLHLGFSKHSIGIWLW